MGWIGYFQYKKVPFVSSLLHSFSLLIRACQFYKFSGEMFDSTTPENRPSPKRKVHLPTIFMGYFSFRHNVYICILSIIHQIKDSWNITSSQSITSPSDNGKTKRWSWQLDKPIHDPSTKTPLPRKHIMHLLLSLALTDSVVFPNKNLHFSQKMPALGCIIMWYWLRLLGEPWPFIKSQHESLKGFALSLLGSMQAGLFHKIGTKKLRP